MSVTHQSTLVSALESTTDVEGATFIAMHGGRTKTLPPEAVSAFARAQVAADVNAAQEAATTAATKAGEAADAAAEVGGLLASSAEALAKAESAVQPEDPAQVAEVAGAAYTVLVGDANKVRFLTDATGVAVTLPNDLPQGFVTTLIQGGDGQLTFAPEAGATVLTADDYTKSRVKLSSALAMVKANVGGSAAQWAVIGDLTDV